MAGINDWNTHHYALHLNRDNTYNILIDNEYVKNGSLFTDFEPPLIPPKEIPDPCMIDCPEFTYAINFSYSL